MIAPLLKEQLEPVARRYRRWQMWRGLSLCWVGAALAGIACISLEQLDVFTSAWSMPVLLIAAGLMALLIWLRTRAMELDLRWVASQVEHQHPELHALLLTAVQQQPGPNGQLSYLQQRVVQEAVAHSQNNSWPDTIASERIALAQAGQWVALAGMLAVLCGFQVSSARTATARLMKAGVTVTPGDASVERGTALVVLARFVGPLPTGATMVIGATPESSHSVPLVKNFNDPVFGASLPEVTGDFVYHVEYGNQRTRDFSVMVYEHPRLEKADAVIKYPAYTAQPEKRIENTRRITAVEGSQLDLSLQLNKPVASAKLVAKDKTVIPLITETNKASVSLRQFPLDTGKTYELVLTDTEGRTNKMHAQFVFDVLKNRTPELKLASPRGDQRVSSLEEMNFQGEAWDDFGLRAFGIAYNVAGQPTKYIELGKDSTGKDKKPINYLLRLEELGLVPDQLVSYFLWADDVGPDGQVRRTEGDMYFAEIRPFEEIFRQGEAKESEGGEPPKGNEATKLADLQKQIISATWKLQREETGKQQPSAKYKKDAPVVQESQGNALEQVQELKEKAEDPRKKIQIEAAEQAMEKALKYLTDATNSVAPLPSALAAEQTAYQALLKLAAREHQVTQQKSRNSKGGNQQQRNQRQLDQLELKTAENRYETERQAKEQPEQQKEQLQALNRLKELAQRQQDVNERLKELQNALQEAKNEQEREEVRRRLKRLREEEQQMLADIDELKQRMEKPENQSQMADARQQLEKTRSEVQKAADALEKESVAQALTSGTRAQRELQEMRDEFRKKNSNQFAEEMRQMRNEARELAQKQEDIGKQMESLGDKNKRKSLTDSGEKKELASQLDDQKKLMTNLLDHATQVTEQAETVEPLLAKQLYDTLRKTSQDNIENSLTMSAELMRQSFVPQATQVEQKARKSINELKNSVEHAADSVLGDEGEALRLARKEIDELTKQVQEEITRANPQLAKADKMEAGQPGDKGSPGEKESPGEQQGKKGQGGKEGKQAAKDGKDGKDGGKEGGKQANGKQPGEKGQGGKEGGQGQGGQQPGESEQAGNSPDGKQAGKQPGQGGGGGGGEGQKQAQQGERQNMEQAATQRGGARQQAGGGGANNAGGGGDINGGGRRYAGRDAVNNLLDDRRGANAGPLTGGGFDNWSDRMREVEEMLDAPELRGDVARIRERLRAMRVEYKRHSVEPKWDVVKVQIADSLVEVRGRINEELARRESKESLVPIDRDPVPGKFSELVKKYYQDLGKND